MKKLQMLFLSTILLFSMAGSAMATAITYIVADTSAGRYTLDFTVINDTLDEAITGFSIFFGQDRIISSSGLNFENWDQFTNFSPYLDEDGTTIVGSEPQPAGWSSYSFEYSSIDLPGQFNSDADDADIYGIAVGASLDSFIVSFDWTGTGSYDNLYFEVFTATNVLGADNGHTTIAGGTQPVPEPATILLLSAGLTGLGFFRKKRKSAC